MNDAQINALMTEAEATPTFVAGKFSEIINMAMAAQENAAQTVYVEKAAPEGDLARLTLGTLRDLLSYSQDESAVAWFASRGVVA